MKPIDDSDYEPTMNFEPGRPPVAAPEPDVLGHYLVAIAGGEPGKRVEIGPVPVTIGRDARQTLAFSDTELSRLHARVSGPGSRPYDGSILRRLLPYVLRHEHHVDR